MMELPPNNPEQIVVCSSCGKRLRVKNQLAGKRVKCPNCQEIVVMAAPSFTSTLSVEREGELQIDSRQIERARNSVMMPAIALIVAGFLGLALNLSVAGFGLIDDFVTPLSDENKERMKAAQNGKVEEPDRAEAVLGISLLLVFSIASGIAILAGFNMLKLRRYGLAVTGSFAVMAGACFCLLAGIPIGIWSLVVLYKPEIRSAFR